MKEVYIDINLFAVEFCKNSWEINDTKTIVTFSLC